MNGNSIIQLNTTMLPIAKRCETRSKSIFIQDFLFVHSVQESAMDINYGNMSVPEGATRLSQLILDYSINCVYGFV